MKAVAIVAQLVAFAVAAQAQPTLFGLTFDGQLITIDAATAAGTLVGHTGLASCDAMAADGLGRLYAISSNDDLYRIDPIHACATFVGDVTQAEFVEELAFSPAGLLYGAGSANADVGAERLITINPLNAQAGVIGPFGAANDVDAMAYSAADGMIYGSDLTLARWLRIDPASGAATNLGSQNNFLFALAFSPAGVLYGTAHSNGSGSPSTLVTLNLASGAASTVGAVGFDSVAGLAFVLSQPACVGDVDGDRRVDLVDLATLLAHFGAPAGATPCQGDLNADGDIDLDDLASMLSRFGTVCS